MPREETTLTGPSKNAENEQSNLDTFSISSAGGGGVTGSPADNNQLEKACDVLKTR